METNHLCNKRTAWTQYQLRITAITSIITYLGKKLKMNLLKMGCLADPRSVLEEGTISKDLMSFTKIRMWKKSRKVFNHELSSHHRKCWCGEEILNRTMNRRLRKLTLIIFLNNRMPFRNILTQRLNFEIWVLWKKILISLPMNQKDFQEILTLT